jgi:FkbM family methyltransferase
MIDKKKIKTIFELGSRDCQDSIRLHEYFNCPVVAFECNPDGIILCKSTLQKYNYPISLVEKAVHEENKIVSFRPFNREKYDNIGASSLFEIDFTKNRSIHDPDYGKKGVQTIIETEAIRLDTYIESIGIIPDLICMDIQEAELLALKGLGNYLKKVKYIALEASNVNTYTGGCSFSDVHAMLTTNNFSLVNTDKLNDLRNQTYVFFDCLYSNNNI